MRATDIRFEVDGTFPGRVTDEAHEAVDSHKVGHREGFCLACAALYVAVMKALPDPPASGSDRAPTNEKGS